MNHNFSRRNRNIKKKQGWLDRQGIYALVVVCLILVGAAAYFTFSSVSDRAQLPTPPLEEVLVQSTPRPTAAPVIQLPPQVEEPPEETEAPAQANAVVKATPPAPQKMTMPFSGEVLRPFSPKDPIYFEALNEWMVHPGVDFTAKEGTEVRAVLSGTVESLANDPALGYTITVSSEGNRKVIYANVASLDRVKKGQSIRQGDVISTVGNSANATKGDPPHVHLEYYENGTLQDPVKAMK